MNRLINRLSLVLLLTLCAHTQIDAHWSRSKDLDVSMQQPGISYHKKASVLKPRLFSPLSFFLVGACVAAGWYVWHNYSDQILAQPWLRRLLHLRPILPRNRQPVRQTMCWQPVHAKETNLHVNTITNELVLVDNKEQYQIEKLNLAARNWTMTDLLVCIKLDTNIKHPELTVFIETISHGKNMLYSNVIIKARANGAHEAFWCDASGHDWHQQNADEHAQPLTDATLVDQYIHMLEQRLQTPDKE